MMHISSVMERSITRGRYSSALCNLYPMKLSAIKGLQCLSNLFTNEATQTGLRRHNVFIRFRPKHIHLERLHYTLSKELALLQSIMTYLYRKRGLQYHSVVELFRRLKLPVFDGIHRALEEFSELRIEKLEHEKTEKSKKRRIMLKVRRTKDAQHRKEW